MSYATSKSVGLVFHDRYLAHDTGLSMIKDRVAYPFSTPVPHPSSPELVGRAKQLIDLAGVADLMTQIDPYEASDRDLLRFHTQDYLERLSRLDKTGGDTGSGAPMGAGGLRIARLSTGGVMAAADAVLTGAVRQAYALVRPPGHHAMAGEGMGFCVFNNVVIAARHAQSAYGVGRIAIVDWDVHHGNGTQSAFYGDPEVLFISLAPGIALSLRLGRGRSGRRRRSRRANGQHSASRRQRQRGLPSRVRADRGARDRGVCSRADFCIRWAGCQRIRPAGAHDPYHQRLSRHGRHHAGSRGAAVRRPNWSSHRKVGMHRTMHPTAPHRLPKP